MPLHHRSPLARLGLYVAAGTVAALATAGPAAAASDPVQPTTEKAYSYKGKVTAKSGLLLRDRPTRNSKVVGYKPYGAYVHIFCKTRGDNVYGNNRWYLLSNGNWAWGSAKYIANVGPAPRWC